MEFKGLNKRVDDAELADGESPDTSNTYFPNNKLQALGPRKGKRFFNGTAYASAVRGIMPFFLPGFQHEIVLALNDGSLRPVDAPGWVGVPGAPYNARVFQLGSAPSATITYPATQELGAAAQFDPSEDTVQVASGDILLMSRSGMGVSGWTESGASSITLTLSAYLLISGTLRLYNSLGLVTTLTRENLGGTAGQAAGTPTAVAGNYGQAYFPITLAHTGTLELIYPLIDASYTNVSAGAFTLGFGDEIMLLRGQIT